jgi:hypothetical protein
MADDKKPPVTPHNTPTTYGKALTHIISRKAAKIRLMRSYGHTFRQISICLGITTEYGAPNPGLVKKIMDGRTISRETLTRLGWYKPQNHHDSDFYNTEEMLAWRNASPEERRIGIHDWFEKRRVRS